jgi:hypothetical protein
MTGGDQSAGFVTPFAGLCDADFRIFPKFSFFS